MLDYFFLNQTVNDSQRCWNFGKILKDDKNKETDKLRKNKTPYITVLFFITKLDKTTSVWYLQS